MNIYLWVDLILSYIMKDRYSIYKDFVSDVFQIYLKQYNIFRELQMNFHNFVSKIFKILIDELYIRGSEYDVWYSLQI